MMDTQTLFFIVLGLWIGIGLLARKYTWAKYVFGILALILFAFCIYGTCYAIYNVIHK